MYGRLRGSPGSGRPIAWWGVGAVAVVLGGLGLAALPTAAYAIPGGVCNGTISNQTFQYGVVVNPGATCTLDNDSVRGFVNVYGVLNITNNFSITGSLIDRPGGQLFIQASVISVGGNLRIDNAAAFSFSASPGSTVNGDFNIVGLSSPDSSLTVDGTTIDGSLNLIYDNVGSIQLGGNTVDGNINCHADLVNPTNGGIPNTVKGREEGQCANLG